MREMSPATMDALRTRMNELTALLNELKTEQHALKVTDGRTRLVKRIKALEAERLALERQWWALTLEHPDDCEAENCEQCHRGTFCNCMDARCPHCA